MRVSLILSIRILNLSSSWKSTMVVGVISGHSALRIEISQSVSGNFERISLAVD